MKVIETKRDRAVSFCDAQCEKCGKRFGWSGTDVNRPPCPSCGNVKDIKRPRTEPKRKKQKRTLNKECHERVVAMSTRCMSKLNTTERMFIRNMRSREEYTVIQRISVKRLWIKVGG